MQDLRKVLCWCFAATSLLYVLVSLRSMCTITRYYSFLTLQNLLIAVLFPGVVAAITGVAWWAIFKREPSARRWGIAASLMLILVFLLPFIFSLRIVWWHHLGALFAGIVGLVEFLRRDERHDSSKNPTEPADYGSGIPRF